jgi:hypothetical protein
MAMAFLIVMTQTAQVHPTVLKRMAMVRQMMEPARMGWTQMVQEMPVTRV